MKQIHALKAAAAIAATSIAAAAGVSTAVATAATNHVRPAVTATGTASTTVSATTTTTTTTAKPVTVTVRIEGLKKTLLASKKVTLKAGWVVKGGDGSGTCPNQSAQGALNVATKGSWAGTWSTAYGPQWEITKILGETDDYSTTSSWWELFTGHVSASTGACEATLKSGEQITFAAVGATATPGDLTTISTPSKVKRNKVFTVKVYYFNSAGKKLPLAGAKVTIAGKSFTAGKAGTARVKVARAGAKVLTVSKAGYIRDEATVKVVK